MNKTVQTLIVIVAGAGAFYGAVEWTRQRASAASSEDSDIVVAVARPAAAAPASAASAADAAASAPAALVERRLPAPGGDAFASLSWVPPPPPPPPPRAPAPPPPPPPPTAPPLPFTFVGMVERGADRPQAYLAKGDALLVVAVGDVIDNGNYRVDALSPTSVVLTYMPLQKQQTLNVPAGTS